ncbi:MAG TPA: aminotransferase class IV [Solirubrobacteraceae bacterium]|nr:aminotransferase class IV [Solirubrobacteraceae bacterium]
MSIGLRAEPPRDALEYGPRPDPELGVLETILVERCAIPALEAHIGRLDASARAIYRREPPSDLAVRIRAQASGHSGRLRVTLTPDGTVTVGRAPLGAPPIYTAVAPFTLPGGLGAHKWADRRLLDALTEAAGGALPLLLDSDGAVLEVSWANVLIEEGARLISPPDDGRALPGIGRRRLEYDEEPVDLDRLLAADAVVLTSALRVVRLPLA